MMSTCTNTRRGFLKKVGLAALSATACGYRSTGGTLNETTPNVLLLISDEHNAKISSVEDHPFVQTPNMERLAKMGVVYESHYVPSPLCTPCRSAFVAGRWVHELQTYNNCCVFKDDYPSYGDVLRRQGVHTVHIGKIDVYRNAYELGFSEMHLGDWTVVRDPGDINFRRSPLTVRSLDHPKGGKRPERYGVVDDPFKADDFSIKTAVDWIRTKGTKMDRPWVVSVNTSKPHFPNEVTQELWDMYKDHADWPAHGTDCESANHPYARDLRKHFRTDEFKPEWIRGLRRGYYGCVTYLDRQLGTLLDVLEETGQLDNTVVAYTSDHGEMLGKFGMWWKCSLYDDSARVPLIVAGPGFRKGVRCSTAVSMLDLQATVFKAVGCRRSPGWVGTPLQNVSLNDPDRVAFSEYHGHGTRASAFMVRKGRWKYIHYSAAPNQLFDMKKDPEELNNVADEYPNIAEDMERELHAICSPEKENTRAEQYIEKELAALEKMDMRVGPGGIATSNNK